MAKKRTKRVRIVGFTLIELLVAIGILAILLAITLIAVNPAEQLSKSEDVKKQAVAADIAKASLTYLASEKQHPWEKNANCLTEIETGGALADMPNCLTELIGGGKLQQAAVASEEYQDIKLNKCGSTAVLCYNPRSKEEYAKATFNKYGVNEPGCPGAYGSSSECYWCKPVNGKPECTPSPSPTTVPTVAPTAGPTEVPTPTPTTVPVNPWGQALTFDGKVAGQNPPSYTWKYEWVNVPFDSRLNLSSPNVTVEAWIKPSIPIAAGYDYRLVDSTYKVTMDARPNGSNITYRYYFDVQSATNGCGRTVVYSHSTNWYPWNTAVVENVEKTVSPTEFVKWKHVAGVLHNGNLHIYENGVLLNSYNINMSVCNAGRPLYIGAGENGPMFGAPWYYNFFQGAIDEVRISTNARYTANFTPPTQPFTPDANTLMLFHFDGNTTDASSNAFNASITGVVPYIESDVTLE